MSTSNPPPDSLTPPRHKDWLLFSYQSLLTFGFLTIVAYWLYLKIYLFKGLDYHTDLFIHLQISYTFWQGEPLFDNYLYNLGHPFIHNFFILPLLFLFTGPFGAYGLFLASALLHLLAIHELYRALSDRISFVVLSLTAMTGPISFWLWDNPLYGWHVETLFFPLTVLFGCSLLRQRKTALLWALLLLLVRENGAVIACCVHLLFLWGSATALRTSLGGLVRASLQVVLLWGMLFMLGLAIPHLVDAPGDERLENALSQLLTLTESPKHLEAIADMLLNNAILASPILVLLALSVRNGAYLLVALVALLPTLMINIISSLIYSIDFIGSYGLTWAPRFAPIWGLLTLGLVIGFELDLAERASRTPKALALTVIVLAFFSQAVALKIVRHYDFGPRFIIPFTSSLLKRELTLSPTAEKTFRCLQDSLEPADLIAAPPTLFALFHRQDYRSMASPPKDLTHFRLIVCDPRNRYKERLRCPVDTSPLENADFRIDHVDGFTLYTREAELRKCVAAEVTPSRSSR